MNINLMFHEVGLNSYSGFYRDGSYNYVISKDEFKLLIDFSIHYSSLTSNNYHYSFDDGGVSNMFSAEYLSKKMLKGIFFIPSNYIGKKGFLSSKDILELKNNGHVIGSHSHTHPRFINKLDYNSQFNEWNKSPTLSFLKIIIFFILKTYLSIYQQFLTSYFLAWFRTCSSSVEAIDRCLSLYPM